MKYIGLLAIWFFCSIPLCAQTGREDGSRFGHGEDSVRCRQNIVLYKGYMQANDYRKAYVPWKAIFEETPWAQISTYTNGTQILRALIAESANEQDKEHYLKELIAVHDQCINYLDSLNTLASAPVTSGFIMGMKVHDYVMFSMHPDIDKAYRMEQQAISQEKENSTYFMLQDLMDLSLQKLKADADHIEQFIQDYLTASHYANAQLKRTGSDAQEQPLWTMTKDYIDSRFIESEQATCEKLQKIYAPKIARHRTDLSYLNQVISTLKQLKCTGEDAYLMACEAAYELSPTAENAAGCGRLCYKRGEIGKSVTFFEEAIMLEPDSLRKSTYCYDAAIVLFRQKQWKQAKLFAQKSIDFNKNDGKAYILIAQMYASSPNWCKETTLNRCTFYAVIDKLKKAQTVDASLTDEATRLIDAYTKQVPNEKSLADLGLQKGNAVIIGGWINETIILR